MTQSTFVKKKKKIESKKPEKNEKKSDTKEPSDWKMEAEKNVKEMLKEAQKIHKNHLRRCNKGKVKPSSKENKEKNREAHKYLVKSVYDAEIRQKKTTIKETTTNLKPVPQDSPGDKTSNQKIPVKAKLKKEANGHEQRPEKISHNNRTQQEILEGSLPTRHITVKNRKSKNPEAERMMNIEDYYVGMPPFVSLELLDKMKCQESDISFRARKGILRKNRPQTPHKSKENKVSRVKVSTKDEKESVKHCDKKISFNSAPDGKKRKVKTPSSQKLAKFDSELIPIPRESTNRKAQNKPKSAISSPKSASSTIDSAVAAGNPLSSNTSRSYFSSESDISKIDRKFIQILEAVTQNSLMLGTEGKDEEIIAEHVRVDPGSGDFKMNHGKSFTSQSYEIEQKIHEKINEIEEKLQNCKSKKDSTQEKEPSIFPKPEENVELEAPIVEQIWRKGNTSHKEASRTSLKTNMDGKKKEDSTVALIDLKEACEQVSEKSPKSKEETENAKAQKSTMKPIRLTRESFKVNPDFEHNMHESVITKHTKVHKKPSKQNFEKGENQDAAQRETNPRSDHRVTETWSIMKRLEKAFTTLGLNLEDLENSEENFTTKKKNRTKKNESCGKDRNKTKRKMIRKSEPEQELANRQQKTMQSPDDIQYRVESNGAGDRNMDYKRVRSSKKIEDLLKQQKKVRVKETYYTTVSHPVKIVGSSVANDIREIQADTEKLKPMKKYSNIEHHSRKTVVNNPCPRTEHTWKDLENIRNVKIHKSKRLHYNDLHPCHSLSKRKSDNSLSASHSIGSISEEETLKRHKRKKRTQSRIKDRCASDDKLWKIALDGKRDHIIHVPTKPYNSTMDRETLNITKNEKTVNQAQLEQEYNELELKEIRQRHKQIISEIETSLKEIKKQHNLYTKLRKQAKLFDRERRAKRRMIESYLRDIDITYKTKNTGNVIRESPKVLSTGSYYCTMQGSTKLTDHHSDYGVQMMRQKKRLRKNHLNRKNSYTNGPIHGRLAREEETSSEVSSIALKASSIDHPTTDSPKEAFRSVTSSLHTARRTNKGKDDRLSMEMLCLEWEKRKESPKYGIKEVPTYLIQLLQKLNRIILTEKNELEDLIVKASGSSSHSSHNHKNKATISSNSSSSSPSNLRPNITEEMNKVTSTVTTSASPKAGSSEMRQKYKIHKKQGNQNHHHHHDETENDELDVSASRTEIQSDPGGGSYDSLTEAILRESFPTQNDFMYTASCTHLQRQAEEFRYRKGDPSFRSHLELLKNMDEHSKHCTERAQENDEAYKRKIELEHILRSQSLTRENETHSLNYESSSRGRHPGFYRHRQKSIIIDHNRGEENEESQTVLGHARRHSVLSYEHRRYDTKSPHSYYLRAMKKSEPIYPNGRRQQEFWKRGRRHHLEEVPVNYCGVSVNIPDSSASKSSDVDCQTDMIEEFEDAGDISLAESSSGHSYL